MAATFLVLWRIDLSLLSGEMARAVLRMGDYARPLTERGVLLARYHVVGWHGGALIYRVESHEELERLLGTAPIYNFATFEVLPLADMGDA